MKKNLLSEGRYDKVTTELSQEMVNAMKQGKKRLQTRIQLYSRTFVDVIVYFHYKDEPLENLESVYGATYVNPKELRKHFKNKRIILHVETSKDLETRMRGISSLVPEIKNIVRHEIEHVNQGKF